MKRQVTDMSGHCRTGGVSEVLHAACHGTWETPSAYVTCRCICHQRTTAIVPKSPGRVLVPKK